MIVEDIHQHTRNPPVRRPQSLHTPHYRRMLIRIAIDLPVQPYPKAQLSRRHIARRPLEEIPQQIPQRHQTFIGQYQQMPQIVHSLTIAILHIMVIRPGEASPRDLYKLMIGMIVPRPIAWVSTVSADGIANLAPFSFFNAFSADPPVVGFAPSRRPTGDTRKDTLRNVEQTGVFVVNIVSESLADAMNASAAEVPPDVDEFTLANVSKQPASEIAVPMVQESLAKLECRVRQILPLGDRPTSGVLVLGDVLCFHVADEIISDFSIDPAMLDAIGRMGGPVYCDTRHRFAKARPGGNSKL